MSRVRKCRQQDAPHGTFALRHTETSLTRHQEVPDLTLTQPDLVRTGLFPRKLGVDLNNDKTIDRNRDP